jgi:hypothetical protein
MDLSFRTIREVVQPSAAFTTDSQLSDEPEIDGALGSDWASSQLNPKNRIDSLEPLKNARWRIDGATGLGTQYFAIPLFADVAPMRIDVFIHEGASYPIALRRSLDLDQAFHTKDADRVRRLGIARYLVRILQFQSEPGSVLAPEHARVLYHRGPFGSRIIVETLSLNIEDCRLRIYANHALEADLCSERELRRLWQIQEKDQEALPPRISIDNLQIVQQLSDSVGLVRLLQQHVPGQYGESSFVAMKSVTSQVKYLYHEIYNLLFHQGIKYRPQHLITKRCLFGSKNAIVGFTMPYLPDGSIRDILPLLRIHGQATLKDQLHWARELTNAMHQICAGSDFFYPDLRLDNVLLSDAREPLLVDFEGRGVWSGFSAPEVEHFENIVLLARDDDGDTAVPDAERDRARDLLSHVTGRDRAWLDDVLDDTRYGAVDARSTGYNVAWLCLSPRERDAATVYMLARVLWCVFEGESAPHRGAVRVSYAREPTGVEWPNFDATPHAVRPLLQRCWSSVTEEPCRFVRVGAKLFMKSDVPGGKQGQYTLDGDASSVRSRARELWRARLAESRSWIRRREERIAAGKEATDHGRPSLAELRRDLDLLNAELLRE